MLHDMFFTLPAWLMFFLGVFLAAWVKSLITAGRSKVSGA